MSKNEFLKRIEVKDQCSQDWEEMTGNERVRFCGHCSFEVNNLSAMSRKQAMKLVRESSGRICVRYVQNPVDKTPVFAERLYQITRRAGIAAGVLGASLSLSTLTYAQGEPLRLKTLNTDAEISQTQKTNEDKTESDSASISGTVSDPQGAVIPGIVVSLTLSDNSFSSTAVSNEEGFYEFKNIPAGNFKLNAEGIYGFQSTIIENISVAQNGATKQNIQMDVGEVAFMGLMAAIEFYTPLHQAVSDDNSELVTELISKGGNVNGKDENYSNITPLFLAVGNGNAEIAERLLNFGAKINARDDERQTPLMRLDEDATVEIVRLLIKHGAKINLTDKAGNTALLIAVEYAKPEVLQELIANGANVNARNKEGETALTKAAYEDNFEKVKILLLAGADVNLKNGDGKTARDQTGDGEIKQLLESYGAAADEN